MGCVEGRHYALSDGRHFFLSQGLISYHLQAAVVFLKEAIWKCIAEFCYKVPLSEDY